MIQKVNRGFVMIALIIDRFLPRDASVERGNATVSRLSVCNV